jgi:DNA-binding response OmpR family regulator
LSHLLVACEDDATRTFLADNLTADGHDIDVAYDTVSAIAKARVKAPDVIVCDLNGSTLQLLDHLTEHSMGIPVLGLTSEVEELPRIRLLERGCTDLMGKPFSYRELALRAKRLADPSIGRDRAVYAVNGLRVEKSARAVTVQGTEVELSQKEFALLLFLVREPTKVWTKEELLRGVWGFRSMGSTRTLDSHACRLRHKLGVHGDRFMVNVWGVGYRLVDAVEAGNVREPVAA